MVLASPEPHPIQPYGLVVDPSAAIQSAESISSLDNDSDDEADQSPAQEAVYCLCRKPDDGKLMVQCDDCMEWFHAACVKLTAESDLTHWLCPNCHQTRLGAAKSPSPSPPPCLLLKSKPISVPVKSNNTTPKAQTGIPRGITQTDNTAKSQRSGSRRNSVKISPITKIVKSVSTPDVPLIERIHQDRVSCRSALAKVVSDDLAFRIEGAVFPSEPASDSIKAYKMKIREIILNLKCNFDLMQSVIEGSVTPVELATKDVSSLAAPDLVAARNEQRQLAISSRLVTTTEEAPMPHVVVAPVPEQAVDIVVPDVDNLKKSPESEVVNVQRSVSADAVEQPADIAYNEHSDSDVSAPVAYEAYKEEHLGSTSTEVVNQRSPADWSGTLAMSPSDEAFSLRGLILNPELKSDRKRFSKLSKALHIHGRVQPSSVHKFLLQVHNIARDMKGSERFNHKRPALVRFQVDEKDSTACNNFVKGYSERNRIPVIDNTELGILLYFVSPIFDRNPEWTPLLQEMFQSSPPEGASLWAIAIISAESKLSKTSSSSNHHKHQHHRSHKEHSRSARAAAAAATSAQPSAGPDHMQLEHLERAAPSTASALMQLDLEHALAEVDSLTKLVDPRLDGSSWRSHDSYGGDGGEGLPGAPPLPDRPASYELHSHPDISVPPDAYRARPHHDSEFIHPDRAARMYNEYRPDPRLIDPNMYHREPQPNLYHPDIPPNPYHWLPHDRYGPARGGGRMDWPAPYHRPPPPNGGIPPPEVQGIGSDNVNDEHRHRRRSRGRDHRRNRGGFLPERR